LNLLFSYFKKKLYTYIQKGMKNKELWVESKFNLTNQTLTTSKLHKEVAISSRLMVDSIAAFYSRVIPLYASGHLLDLGCGKVPLYGFYRSYIEDNTCVDWSNSLHQNKHVDLFMDLNHPLNLDKSTYSTIILSDVLEHIRNPDHLWKEMSRVIQKDGYLLMNVPFYYWIHEEPHDYFRYTKYALMSMAEDNDFEIVEIKPLGGVPEIIADIVSKNLMNIRILGKPLVLFIQVFVRSFISLGIGRKLSSSTSEKFPYGYALVARKK
jgi:SAM-dependent methyltransferase